MNINLGVILFKNGNFTNQQKNKTNKQTVVRKHGLGSPHRRKYGNEIEWVVDYCVCPSKPLHMKPSTDMYRKHILHFRFVPPKCKFIK